MNILSPVILLILKNALRVAKALAARTSNPWDDLLIDSLEKLLNDPAKTTSFVADQTDNNAVVIRQSR